MTEVLARARELVRHAGMQDESWKASTIQKALAEKLSQLASSGQGDVSDADSVLVHFKDHSNRISSFSTNGGWPLQRPTVADLADAGFFYAPLPGCEDRVACYACGKVLFNWDPADEIIDAHRLFSPNCPLVTGKPVELPLPKKEEKPAWVVSSTEDGKVAALANLSNFVESLRQTASSVDVEELVKRAKPKGGRKHKQENTGFPTAQLASDSEQTASDTDNSSHATLHEGDMIRRHEGSMKKKASPSPPPPSQTGMVSISGAVKRAERLWRFDWSVPDTGRLQGQEAIMDAQAGELEMRLATAKKLMLEQKDDWMATALRVESACREMEGKYSSAMDAASARLEGYKTKADAIAERVKRVRDDDMLRERGEELKQLRQEGEQLARQKKEMEQTLADLRRHTAAERADIDLIKDKIATNERLDAQVADKQAKAKVAEESAKESEDRRSEALRKMKEMEEAMTQMRDELRDDISQLHHRKLEEESALAEASEQMLRVKRLYGEYKERLGELQRRETLCETREQEMRSREEHVSRRENTLKAREEWMAKRESEFRIQQRALENNLSLPRNVATNANSGAGGSGEAASGGGDSGNGSLADQVLQAQAEYAIRPNQAIGMAMGKGKAGAKEAAQRDYKAILNTTEKIDPQAERESAKASRRKEILKMFPGLGKKTSSKTVKAPAASFFDMNSI